MLCFMVLSVGFAFFQSADLRVPLESSEKLAIHEVLHPNTVDRNRMVEVRIRLGGTYTNPFHRAQMEVTGEIEGPGRVKWSVPAFYYQEFRRTLENEREKLERVGNPEWRLRFRPHRVGKWTFKLHAQDLASRVTTKTFSVQVLTSKERGTIRASEKAPTYFECEEERPFFPVGLNLAWPGPKGLDDYEEWFANLAASGGNFVRIWSFPGWAGLEWSDLQDGTWRRGTYYGLGKYSLDNAWLLDRVLESADKHGIRVLLCLGTYGELKEEKGFWNEQLWHANPYNTALGGPCRKPEDFFTDLKARSFYRRRLEYLVARYAAYPSLFGWELWNEVEAPDYWVDEMARELRHQDPYKHPVTTSYGSESVWKLGSVGFLTHHLYGDGSVTDLAERVVKLARENAQFRKPHLLTELGIDFKKSDKEYDKEAAAVNLRVGLWKAAASGFAGGALAWWWNDYVAPLRLWNVYEPFAKAVQKLNWTRSPMKPVEIREPPQGVVCTGVISEHAGLLWLRDASYDWRNWKKASGVEHPASYLELESAKDGKWRAVWWDTKVGREVDAQEVVVRRGVLRVRTVPFVYDVALLLFRE